MSTLVRLRPRRRSNVPARTLRNLGLAVWAGGAAFAATALHDLDEQHLRQARTAWRPVETAAVMAHLAGSAALGWAGRHRAWYQAGMPTAMLLDTAATAGALAAMAGRRRWRHADAAVALIAAGSLVAQAFMAEQQRPVRTLQRLRRPWS